MSLSRRAFVKTLGFGTAGALTSSFISARGREALTWGADPLQDGDIIIASNENPVGPGQAVLDAIDDVIGSDGAILGRYAFGMDRTVADVASHRALECDNVLWELIGELTRTASNLGKAMAVCGELAGNPDLTDRLMRCGITAVSANPANVAAIRRSAKDRRI